MPLPEGDTKKGGLEGRNRAHKPKEIRNKEIIKLGEGRERKRDRLGVLQ